MDECRRSAVPFLTPRLGLNKPAEESPKTHAVPHVSPVREVVLAFVADVFVWRAAGEEGSNWTFRRSLEELVSLVT